MNQFEKLYSKDLKMFVEVKENLKYVSWANAWLEFKREYPDAIYEIKHFNGVPYFFDQTLGYMVETSVTANNLTHGMWLPVMNGANKAMTSTSYTYQVKKYTWSKETKRKEWFGEYDDKIVEKATMFDINTAIMRCLVKNLAMFGLGLYIYAGEDIPQILEDDNKDITVEDSEVEKLYSELEKVLEEKFNNKHISEKLYEKLLADGMRLSRGSGDPEALRLMIENAKQMKKVDPVKPVVKENFTTEKPAEKPEIKAEIPKPDSLLTTMNNLKTQIELYINRALKNKVIDQSQADIFSTQVLTCNTVPQLTDKLQEISIILVDYLHGKINQFYTSLAYEETHKQRSIKKYLETESIEACGDVEKLWALTVYLSNEKKKQKEGK